MATHPSELTRRSHDQGVTTPLASDPIIGAGHWAGSPGRRRGRPPRSVDPAAGPAHFGLEQFAAVRSYLSGVEPRAACVRYLTNESAPSSEAAALRRLIGLLSTLAGTAAARPQGTAEALQVQRAARVLQDCLRDAHRQREALLARDRLSRLSRRNSAGGVPPQVQAVPQPTTVAVSSTALPTHFDRLDAFREHYIETRLFGVDPDLGEDEWEAMFVEALDALEPISREEPLQLASARPLATLPRPALAHAEEIQAGLSPARSHTSQEALAALEQCRWVVTRLPKATDQVDTWFSGHTVKRLKPAGLLTLAQLATHMHRYGLRWWRPIHGLGPTRGQRITDWMHSVATEAGLDLRPGEARSGARHPPDGGLLPSRSDPTPASGWEGLGLEPLARLSLATPLDSPTGLFRLPGANLLGARSDLEAIAGVLTQYADRPATLAVYSREICRYALWCHRELGKPISSVTLPEARRFRAFLDQIPAEWIQPGPCPRHSPHWRPFRGQLDDASKRKTLTAVHVVLHQLQATGYLVGNALSGLLKRSSVAKPSMDIHRSFGEAEWALVLEQLDRVAEDPDVLLPSRVDRPMEWGDRRRLVPLARQRRLKALVRLLQVTGLRREECEQARLSHLNRVDLDQQVFYTLDVVGKGQKRRQVYVPEAIVHLVQDHLADRASAGFEDDDETASGRSRIPLISVLRSPRASGTATVSQRVVGHGAPARTSKNCGAWSAAGMHMELKRFFARCALAAPSHGLSQDRFEAASAHWLRHTFGTMLADQQTDLRTIQAAMGHANINTTAQYSKKSRDKMLRELHAGMPASMRS